MLLLFHLLIIVVWLSLHGDLLSMSRSAFIISRLAQHSVNISTIGEVGTDNTRKTMPESNHESNWTKEPLITFFPQDGETFYGFKSATGYEAYNWLWENVSACPYKCRFAFDWAKFKTEADLVVVNLFNFAWDDEKTKSLLNSSE